MRNEHSNVHVSEVGRARRPKSIEATVCGAQGRVEGQCEVDPGPAEVSKQFAVRVTLSMKAETA